MSTLKLLNSNNWSSREFKGGQIKKLNKKINDQGPKPIYRQPLDFTVTIALNIEDFCVAIPNVVLYLGLVAHYSDG